MSGLQIDIKSLEKLDRTNARYWFWRMQSILEERDCWGVVSGEEPRPQPVDDEEEDGDGEIETGVVHKELAAWIKKDSRARTTIIFRLKDAQILLVRLQPSAQDGWECLKRTFKQSFLSEKLYLWKKFFKTKMKEGDNPEEHITKMQALASQLGALKHRVQDEDLGMAILASLPKSYKSLKQILGCQEGKLKSTAVIGVVLQASHFDDEEEEEAALEECNLAARPTSSCGPPECWKYGKNGHIARFCPSKAQTGALDISGNSSKSEHAKSSQNAKAKQAQNAKPKKGSQKPWSNQKPTA